MKKIVLILVSIALAISVQAQSKFEVKDFGTFKLHTYVTADPLGDMSFVIEGKKALVVLEPAAFVANIKEFGEYIARLNKPVEKVIANYHAAGFSGFEHSKFVMVEGMPEFVKGETYSGMMKHFESTFGDAIDSSEFAPSATVAKDAKVKWAGVEFCFLPGASSDFPAASICIGKKVYYTHFTPAIAHFSAIQIANKESLNATLAVLEQAKASGATTFIGGHGREVADMDVLDFQIAYLRKAKETVEQIKTGDEFILVMKMLYPNLAGENHLQDLATGLYN